MIPFSFTAESSCSYWFPYYKNSSLFSSHHESSQTHVFVSFVDPSNNLPSNTPTSTYYPGLSDVKNVKRVHYHYDHDGQVSGETHRSHHVFPNTEINFFTVKKSTVSSLQSLLPIDTSTVPTPVNGLSKINDSFETLTSSPFNLFCKLFYFRIFERISYVYIRDFFVLI